MFSLDYSEFVSLAGEEDYINKMPFSSRLIKGVYYQHDLPLLLLPDASWEICMQVRKQQWELDMEQQTGPK